MKLSEIEIVNSNLIKNEKDFESLGILDSITDKKICTFIENEKYIDKIKDNVTMLITNKETYLKIRNLNLGFYIVENPRITFFEIHNYLANNILYKREEYKTRIGKNCNISDKAYISSNNVTIGDNVTIEEFVSIKENTIIGDNCIIGAGTVIGGSGFEFKRIENKINSVKHLGGVIIKDNVEIQYNTVIDKAIYPWDNTVIEEYTKIDNLNHIAHACKIGKRVLLPAGSIVAGRVVIDDDAWIGIGCAIRNGLHIGKNARCNMGAIVTKDVDDNKSVTGNFAIDHEKFISNMKKINMEGKSEN